MSLVLGGLFLFFSGLCSLQYKAERLGWSGSLLLQTEAALISDYGREQTDCAVADSKRNRWGLPDGGAKLDWSHNAAYTYPVEIQGKQHHPTLGVHTWYEAKGVWRI